MDVDEKSATTFQWRRPDDFQLVGQQLGPKVGPSSNPGEVETIKGGKGGEKHLGMRVEDLKAERSFCKGFCEWTLFNLETPSTVAGQELSLFFIAVAQYLTHDSNLDKASDLVARRNVSLRAQLKQAKQVVRTMEEATRQHLTKMGAKVFLALSPSGFHQLLCNECVCLQPLLAEID